MCTVPHSLTFNTFLQIIQTQIKANFLYSPTGSDEAIDLISVPDIQRKEWPTGKKAKKALQRNSDGGLMPKQNIVQTLLYWYEV